MSALLVLLALSLKGAAVAALVALALALAGRLRIEVPAFLRHALWLVVFVRLLVPVLPASPASLLSLRAPLEEAGGGLLPGLDLERLASGAASGSARAGTESEETAGAADRWWLAAAGVWLLGLLTLAGRATVRELGLRRRLRDAVPVADPAVLAALEEARRRVGLPPGVPVLETAEVAAPAIHGALRPRILLPPDAARALGPEALRHALLHELAHVRRRDGATRLLARLAAAVHWFNPAAWYALGRLEAECELACDAAVLGRLGGGERAGYGRTLLHAPIRNRRRSGPRGHRAPALHPSDPEEENPDDRSLPDTVPAVRRRPLPRRVRPGLRGPHRRAALGRDGRSGARLRGGPRELEGDHDLATQRRHRDVRLGHRRRDRVREDHPRAGDGG